MILQLGSFLKKWFSLEKANWTNSGCSAGCVHFKTLSMSQASLPGVSPSACHAAGQWAPKSCTSRAGRAQRPPGCSSKSHRIWSCYGLVVHPKAEGLAALISGGPPHTLPEGEAYSQLWVPKSASKGKREGIFDIEICWGTKFQMPTVFFWQCKCPSSLCCLQALHIFSYCIWHNQILPFTELIYSSSWAFKNIYIYMCSKNKLQGADSVL